MKLLNLSGIEGGVSVLTGISVWWVFTEVVQTFPSSLVPSPREVFNTVWILAYEGALFSNTGATVWRWLCASVGGIGGGIGIGLLAFCIPRAFRLLRVPIEFMRGIPPAALFPVMILFFGVGDQANIATGFIPATLVMILATTEGLQSRSRSRAAYARTLRCTPIQMIRSVVIPEVLPHLISGSRLAVSFAMIAVVVSEMFIGTSLGVGQRIHDAYLTNSSATLWGYLLVLGTLSYFVNSLLEGCRIRYGFWSAR